MAQSSKHPASEPHHQTAAHHHAAAHHHHQAGKTTRARRRAPPSPRPVVICENDRGQSWYVRGRAHYVRAARGRDTGSAARSSVPPLAL
jgi:hypothetical protein